MSHINQELSDALSSYDRTHGVIDILRHMRWEVLHPSDPRKRDRMVFYDTEDRVVYETDVETLALYYPVVGLYTWSWAVPTIRPSLSFLSRQVLQFCLDENVSLYTRAILTTGRSIVADITQVDINLALAITLIRRPFILPREFTDPGPANTTRIEFISFIILLDDGPLEAWSRTGIPPAPRSQEERRE